MRAFGLVAAALLVAASVYAAGVGVSLAPFGGWLRAVLFPGGTPSCDPDAVESLQAAAAIGALLASVGALARSLIRRSPWLFAVAAIALLVAWSALLSAGECSMDFDD